MVERRANWSRQKKTILKALFDLKRSDAEPTACDDRLEVGFFDVATIARHIFGDQVFIEGKLNRSRRASINKSLSALHFDGFVDKHGSRYRGWMRDFSKNFWSIKDLGVKVLSLDRNRMSLRWRRENRFYGVRGIKVDRSQVKRIAASEYWADLD